MNIYGEPKQAFPIPAMFADVEKDFDYLLLTLSESNKVNMRNVINQLPLIEGNQELDIGAYLVSNPKQDVKYNELLKHSFYRIYKAYKQSGRTLSEKEVAHFFELLRIAIRPYTLFQNRGMRIRVMKERPAKGLSPRRSRTLTRTKSKSPKVMSWGTRRVKKT